MPKLVTPQLKKPTHRSHEIYWVKRKRFFNAFSLQDLYGKALAQDPLPRGRNASILHILTQITFPCYRRGHEMSCVQTLRMLKYQSWLYGILEKKCECTTHVAGRTTHDDGRQAIAIDHLNDSDDLKNEKKVQSCQFPLIKRHMMIEK